MRTAVRREAIAMRRYGASSVYSGLLSIRPSNDSRFSIARSSLSFNSSMFDPSCAIVIWVSRSFA